MEDIYARQVEKRQHVREGKRPPLAPATERNWLSDPEDWR